MDTIAGFFGAKPARNAQVENKARAELVQQQQLLSRKIEAHVATAAQMRQLARNALTTARDGSSRSNSLAVSYLKKAKLAEIAETRLRDQQTQIDALLFTLDGVTDAGMTASALRVGNVAVRGTMQGVNPDDVTAVMNEVEENMTLAQDLQQEVSRVLDIGVDGMDDEALLAELFAEQQEIEETTAHDRLRELSPPSQPVSQPREPTQSYARMGALMDD